MGEFVAVTGATGLLGNNVVRALLERGGPRVRVLLRPTSPMRPLEGLDVDVRRIDLARATEEEIVRVLDRVGTVVHCGAMVGIGLEALDRYRAANVQGTVALLGACRRLGCRLVHVSTVDTRRWGTRDAPATEDDAPGPDLGIPYVVTKREAEAAVLEAAALGLDAVVVNPAYLLGPWDWKPSSGRMLLGAASAPILVAPPGGNDFVHAEDVATGIIAAAERGRRGERYILGGEALSYREAFELFSSVAGRPRTARTVPAWLVRVAGRGATILGGLGGGEYDVNVASAAMSVLPHHFSSAKAARELGYQPRPAADAARDAWNWFRTHGYA